MKKNYYVVNVDYDTWTRIVYEETVIATFSSKKAAEAYADKVRARYAQGSCIYVTDVYPTEERNYF